MNELSPRVRAIVEAARAADDPTGEDRARVRGAVLKAIAAGAPVALGAASAKAMKGGAGGKVAGSGLAVKIAGVIGVAIVAGAGVFAAASREDGGILRAKDALVALADSVDLPEPPADEGPVPIQNEGLAPEGPREDSIRPDLPREGEEPRGGARPPQKTNTNTDKNSNTDSNTNTNTKDSNRTRIDAPASSLEEETKRLREAHKALRSGQPERALELLEEQSAAFASGELREERAAARVFALCEAGKTSDAKAAAQAFLRENPRSPLAGRVRGACAGKDSPAGD